MERFYSIMFKCYTHSGATETGQLTLSLDNGRYPNKKVTERVIRDSTNITAHDKIKSVTVLLVSELTQRDFEFWNADDTGEDFSIPDPDKLDVGI